MPSSPLPFDEQTERGSPRAALANAVVRIHAKYYGRGPTRARAHVHTDFALVVLEDVYTQAERTLIAAGKFDHVEKMRSAFQQALKEEFVSAAEEITGRRVRAFISQSNEQPELSVELFIFEPVPGTNHDGGPPGDGRVL